MHNGTGTCDVKPQVCRPSNGRSVGLMRLRIMSPDTLGRAKDRDRSRLQAGRRARRSNHATDQVARRCGIPKRNGKSTAQLHGPKSPEGTNNRNLDLGSSGVTRPGSSPASRILNYRGLIFAKGRLGQNWGQHYPR